MSIMELESGDISVCFALNSEFNVVIGYHAKGVDYSVFYVNGQSVNLMRTDYKGNIIESPNF